MSAIESMVQQLSTATVEPFRRPFVPTPRDPNRRKLPDQLRSEIIALKEDGLTNQAVADMCGVSNSTVSRVVMAHRLRRTDDARSD